MLLTHEEIEAVWVEHGLDECDSHGFARAIEAKILEKIGKPVCYFYHDHEGTLREAHDLRFKEAYQPLYKLPEVKWCTE